MNDAEFRRRAHALLSALTGPLRPGSGTELDLDEHEDGEMRDLLAAGPYRSSSGLRAAIVAELDKGGVSKPYEIAERMDAPFSAVPEIIRDLGLVRRAGDGSFMRPPCKEPF